MDSIITISLWFVASIATVAFILSLVFLFIKFFQKEHFKDSLNLLITILLTSGLVFATCLYTLSAREQMALTESQFNIAQRPWFAISNSIVSTTNDGLISISFIYKNFGRNPLEVFRQDIKIDDGSWDGIDTNKAFILFSNQELTAVKDSNISRFDLNKPHSITLLYDYKDIMTGQKYEIVYNLKYEPGISFLIYLNSTSTSY